MNRRTYEPDDRPSTGQLVGAACLFVFTILAVWLATIISKPL